VQSEYITCAHCGSTKHNTGDAVCNRFDKQVPYQPSSGVFDDSQPSLSLIVVDLDDSCVVKVERGELPVISCIRLSDIGGNTQVVDGTFSELRAAIEGDKPVPRNEQMATSYYCLKVAEDMDMKFGIHSYDALSQIAGSPLKVWKGNGKWTQLATEPVAVWRFER